jgi:hypothetical protein
MSKKRGKVSGAIKQQIERRLQREEPKRQRDAAYRKALRVAANGKLPSNIGNTASAGGGRDRRGKVGNEAKRNPVPNGARVKLIG